MMAKPDFWIKGSIILSILSVTILLLQFQGLLSVPLFLPLSGLLFYPALRLCSVSTWISDGVYLIISFVGLGSVLAVSSRYPIGYADVHKHLFATEVLINGGSLQEIPASISVGFVGLYLLVDMIGQILGIDIVSIARFLPTFSFVLSVGLFYLFLARPILRDNRSIFATIFFGLNWGVFRFLIEYRTINLAFPLIIILLAFLYDCGGLKNRSPRSVLLFTTVSSAAAISHFASFIFYLITALSILFAGGINQLITRNYRNSIRNLVALSTIFLVVVMLYMNNTFEGGVGFIILQLESILFESAVGGANTGGVVGNQFGPLIFLMRWIHRFGFILAFLFFSINWISNPEQYRLELMSSSVTLGIILAISGVLGFALNPSRVFLYFAIPFAIILSSGLFSARDGNLPFTIVNSDQRRKLIYSSLIIIMVVTVLFVTPFKFPQAIIGDTEPIRGEQQIDQHDMIPIGQQQLSVREFTISHGITNQRLAFRGNGLASMRLFFGSPDLYRTQPTPTPDTLISFSGQYSESDNQLNRIYANDKINIYNHNQLEEARTD